MDGSHKTIGQTSPSPTACRSLYFRTPKITVPPFLVYFRSLLGLLHLAAALEASGAAFDFGTSPHGLSAGIHRAEQETQEAASFAESARSSHGDFR